MIRLARLQGERETNRVKGSKGSQTAQIGRCRGRKRDGEHLCTFLLAEKCLSPQAAQYEARSQLQLMVK